MLNLKTQVNTDPLTGGHMGPPLQNCICHLRFDPPAGGQKLKVFCSTFDF